MITALTLIFYIFGVIATLGYFVMAQSVARNKRTIIAFGSLLYPIFWTGMIIGAIAITIRKKH